MSDYNGCYLKLAGEPAFYAVDDGHKRLVESPTQMQAIGLREICIVSKDELDAVPFWGESDEEE